MELIEPNCLRNLFYSINGILNNRDDRNSSKYICLESVIAGNGEYCRWGIVLKNLIRLWDYFRKKKECGTIT